MKNIKLSKKTVSNKKRTSYYKQIMQIVIKVKHQIKINMIDKSSVR